MTTLHDRFQKGQSMRALMTGGALSHFTLPGIDQLAPDLKRIIDESLFGSVWRRPRLAVQQGCNRTTTNGAGNPYPFVPSPSKDRWGRHSRF